ncbi:hypothetical protein BV898_08325 [Hypsibius exemplaris]|uniref:G-protein coupled receptors family 1 profile domain-containing protein n=1 Tax=Hypsibius exemplaris TaxID=2072580 RepID=A0A1W0WQS6_HYPEX|nr:hypothetical protein BV898_08325 [Hypsibius exemplaris]
MPERNTSTPSTTIDNVWTFIPVCSLVLLVLLILTNGTVLYLFLRHSHLRTPFNIYLINLLTARVLTQLIQVPLYLAANLRPPHWSIGRPACTVYLYGFFIQSGVCNAHGLISINRLWAVLRPISYRRLHTKRTACIICGIMWLYIHAITLPGFIADALYHRLPEEQHGCFLNKGPQLGWAYMHQFADFSLPVLVMVLAYPVICYKMWTRGAVARRGRIQPLSSTSGVMVVSYHEKVTEPNSPDVGRSSNGAGGDGDQRNTPSWRSFWVLTIATVGMLVFWMPSNVFYTAQMFQDVSRWTGLADAGTVLLFVESVTDPILFTLALRDLRTAFMRTFCSTNSLH